MNTNKQLDNSSNKPPLSHRGGQAPLINAAQAKRGSQPLVSANNNVEMGNDDYLPLMMLNPPIALFEQEDRARFNGNDESS